MSTNLLGVDTTTNVPTPQQTGGGTPLEELFYILQQRNASPRAFELLQNVTSTLQQAEAAVQQAQNTAASRPSASATVRQLQQQMAEVTTALQNMSSRIQGVEAQPQQQQQRPASQSRSVLTELLKKSLPAKFDGTPHKLNAWKFAVQQYLDFCGLTSSNEKAKFAATLLEGRAQTWWRGWSQTSMGNPSNIDLDDLFTGLTSQFADIDRDLKLRRKLGELRQAQSVQSYVNEFRRLQLELGDYALDDAAALFQFLHGLKDQVRTQVLLARPDTFEDAVLVAERCDAAIMFARGLSGSGGANHSRHKGKGRYYPGSYQGRGDRTPMDLGTVQQGQARDGTKPGGSKIVCYHCGKVGHIKRNCFKLKGKDQRRGGAVQVVEASGSGEPSSSKN